MGGAVNAFKTPDFVKDELRKGEHITWIAQPDKIWIFRITSPLMLVALALAIGMRHHVDLEYRGVFDLFIWAIDLAKFAPVVAFAVAPLFLSRLASRAYFVITDQRVITVTGGRRRTYESVELKDATPVMRMDILGRTMVRWDAPGFHRDSEGQSTRNGIVWHALDPKSVAKMGVNFPDYKSIAGQNTFR